MDADHGPDGLEEDGAGAASSATPGATATAVDDTVTASTTSSAGSAVLRERSLRDVSKMNAAQSLPRPALTSTSSSDRKLKKTTRIEAAAKFDFLAAYDDPRAQSAGRVGKVYCVPCGKELFYRPSVMTKHSTIAEHVAAVERLESPQGRLQTRMAQCTGIGICDGVDLKMLQTELTRHLMRDLKLNMNQIDKLFDRSSPARAAMSILFASGARLLTASATRSLAYESLEDELKVLIDRSSSYTLQVDESPTELAAGRSVVVFSAIFSGSEQPVVVDVKLLVGSLCADRYLELLRSVVQKLGDPRKFVALATDNCATMLAFARKACIEYPAIVHVGCLAHIADRVLERTSKVWGHLGTIASNLNGIRRHRDTRCRSDASAAGIRLSSLNYCATRWSAQADTLSVLVDLDQWQKLRTWLNQTPFGVATVAACK
ncbi:MAG: hypothetical protein EOP52_14165, partial [Sphingobacteriales bacterium]